MGFVDKVRIVDATSKSMARCTSYDHSLSSFFYLMVCVVLAGELMLPHKSVDLLRSEAVEAFLYRNIRVAPLQKPANLIKSIMGDSLGEDYQLKGLAQHADQGSFYQHFRNKSRNVGSGNANNAQSPRSNSLSPCTPFSHQMQDEEPESFVDAMWTRGPLAIMAGELCGVGGCNVDPEDSPSSAGSSVSSPGTNKRFHGMACTSRALGTADTLDIQDSFVDVSTVASMQSSVIRGQHRSPASLVSPKSPPSAPRIWRLAQFPSIIKSERKLVLSYRKTALTTIEKLDILLEEESNIGTAWKRFSIAVSNLFSYEKEVENARLGDKKIHRDHMPYRKVKKSTVDECLRVMAQQKVDRSVPSLRALKGMLTAYVADLSSVSPSVDSYLEGISQMLVFEEAFEAQQTAFECNSTIGKSVTPASNSTRSENVSKDKKLKVSIFGNLQEHLKSIAKSAKGGDEKKTDEGDVMQTNSTSSDECESKMSLRATAMQRRRVVEDRVLGNERLLKDSLTTLCRSANVRTARMAWAFFKSEAMQCSLLHSAAGSLRNQIDLTNNEAVTKMVSRHHDENKEDMKTELALVQRMVNLGNMKRFPIAGVGPNSEAETIEVDSDNQDEERAKAMLRDNALQVARERVGRWNSQLAMAVMHAVGVDDANVRVEETTRELRLVRKYAIGLRENLNRCIEAVELLRNAILKGRNNSRPEKDTGHKKMTRHINETRKELFSALAKLLSGIFVSYPELPATSDSTQTTLQLLAKAGVKTNDPFGWSTPFSEWAQELKVREGSVDLACLLNTIITLPAHIIAATLQKLCLGWRNSRSMWRNSYGIF